MSYLDPQIITKTHDSLRISDNGLWNWCSHGVGDRNALEYLVQVKGLPFINAVESTMGRAAEVPPIFILGNCTKFCIAKSL